MIQRFILGIREPSKSKVCNDGVTGCRLGGLMELKSKGQLLLSEGQPSAD